MEGLEIRPLAAEHLDDYLWFMEHDAFRGNPDWEGCYCREGHVPEGGDDLDDSAEANRVAIVELVRGGGHHGLLAYEGGRVVGWCHATPIASLQSPLFLAGRTGAELANTGAVVCFNLAESHRRMGLPGILLRAACEAFTLAGLSVVEGFPYKEPSPRPGRNYRGTVGLFEIHGFRAAGEAPNDAVIMRRDLARERSEP